MFVFASVVSLSYNAKFRVKFMENDRQIMQVIKMQIHLHCTFILCGQQQAGNWSGREYCQMSGVCMAVFAKKEILLGTVRLILVIKCDPQ